MKKTITILLALLILCSCGSKEKNIVDETNDFEIKANEENNIKNTTVEIWDVELEDEYDDINTWFTTRANYGDNDLDNHTLIYNRDDLYNSKGEYKYVIDSYKKGGLLTYKDNYVGIVDCDGNVVYKNTLGYSTNQFFGMLYSDYNPNAKVTSFLLGYNYDVEKDLSGGHIAGGGEHYTLGFFHKDGYVIDGESKSKRDIFNEALEKGYILDDDKILFNAYGAYYDLSKSSGCSTIPSDCLEGYILIGKNNYQILPIPKEYTIVDYSNNIVTCARINEYETTTLNMSSSIYAFETCDMLSYSDLTYINEEGRIIASGYDDGYGFYEEYAAVCKDNKWGYIDKQGNVVVDFIFNKATPLCDGKAWVIYKGKTGRLNIIDMLSNGIEFNKDNLS